MTNVTGSNFGLLVAYLLPGFVALCGMAAYSETVRAWLTTGGSTSPTVGGFLYVTLASVTAGLIVSTVRWAIVDPVHHVTGVRPPEWDFTSLPKSLSAFELLVESHYRYYQFYANMSVAAGVAYVAWRTNGWIDPTKFDLSIGALECILLVGSRDALRKYYRRAGQLLSYGRREPRSDAG